MNPYELLMRLESLKGAAYSGSEVPIAELRSLEKALRDNMMKAAQNNNLAKAGVGYPMVAAPQDSSTTPGGAYAPLVPQSIQPVYDTVTAGAQHLTLQKKIKKTSVTTPVFEYMQLQRYGGTETSPFVSEAGVPAITQSHFNRKAVRMKYMAVFRQLTDVLLHTQLFSGVGAARAIEASNGSMELALHHERYLVWGDSAVNPLEYDGIIASVERQVPENVIDLEGGTISGQEIQAQIARLVSAPYFAEPSEVMMTPRHLAWYENQLLPFRRGDLSTDGTLTWHAGQLSVGTYQGKVPFSVMPLLEPIQHPLDTSEGDGPPASLVPVLTAVAGGSASKWRAADVNGVDFWYTFVIVGDGGSRRTVNVGPVALTAGQAVQVDIPDSAELLSGLGSVRSYVVFRATVPTGTTPSSSQDYFRCGRYARNQDGPGGATRFLDLNHNRPNTAPIIVMDYKPDVIEWMDFLPVTMRPITISRSTTEQFLLTMFGALRMGNPRRVLVFKNVGYG